MTKLLTASALALLLTPQSESESEIKLTADFAWGRYYRAGALTPVRVIFDNPGPTFRGTLLLRWTTYAADPKRKFTLDDLDGSDATFYESPVVLPEKSRQIHTVYVSGEHQRSERLLALLVSEKRIAGYAEIGGNPVELTSLFVGVVGSRQPAGLRQAWEPAAELGFMNRPDELPDRWYGFAGLDALVWLDGDPSLMRDAVQETALKHWLIQGGHLIVVRGKAAELQRSFLGDLLPAEILGDAQGDMTRLVSLYGTRAPKGEADYLLLKPKTGAHVLFSFEEHPVGVRASYGRGQVTLVGIDLAREPFARWNGMPNVWRNLISRRPLVLKDQNLAGFTSTDPGLFALGSAGLIQTAQQFPGIEPPSMGWAFSLILVFMVLIGPVDYIVLRKLRRFELTWITFPSLVVGFSALALFGRGSFAAERVLVREMGIHDYYQDLGLERGWSVVSLLSIDDATFSIESPRSDSTLASHRASMYAIGQNYGGRLGGSSRDYLAVRLGEKSRFEGWSIARGGQGVLSSEWCAPAKTGVSFQVQGKPPELLTLNLDNPYPEPIQGAVLVTGEGSYAIGLIEPGKSLKRIALSYRNWREGVQFASSAQIQGVVDGWEDQRYYEYGYRRSTDAAQLESGIRQILTGLSFHSGLREVRAVAAGSQFTGMARDWDSTEYVEDGGWVLIGTRKRKSDLKFSPSVDSSGDQVLIRTFHRHD